MKRVTSTTVFNDAIGKRMSMTFSEIDDSTGQVISDNNRMDRVVTDETVINHANALAEYAQTYLDNAD